MLQKTGISGMPLYYKLFCQETEAGKIKPSGIATSSSKHDIKLPTHLKRRYLVFNFFRHLIDELYILHSKQQVWDGNEQSTETHIQLCENIIKIDNVSFPKNLKVLSKKRMIMKKPSKKHIKTKSGLSKSLYLRRRKSSCVHLVMTCLTLWTLIEGISCTESNVTWNLKTKPAIFGGDVKLECVISNNEHSCEDYIRQWYGGVHYGLLCEDGMCRNDLKYKEVNVSSCIYHLVIHNFTERDLNQNFTCSYGIFNERKGLSLKGDLFELHPTNESLLTTIEKSDDSISVHLEMLRVYPVPTCISQYKGSNNITELVQQSVGKVGRFFKVNYTLNYSTKDHCEGESIIGCTIGSSYMNIHVQNISQICPGKNRQSRFPVVSLVGIVVGIPATVTIISIVALVLSRKLPILLDSKLQPGTPV